MKLINRTSTPDPGQGAGSGMVDTEVYECPCGKGTVTVTHDRIPGFRDSDIFIDCDECREKYGAVSGLSDLE